MTVVEQSSHMIGQEERPIGKAEKWHDAERVTAQWMIHGVMKEPWRRETLERAAITLSEVVVITILEMGFSSDRRNCRRALYVSGKQLIYIWV